MKRKPARFCGEMQRQMPRREMQAVGGKKQRAKPAVDEEVAVRRVWQADPVKNAGELGR